MRNFFSIIIIFAVLLVGGSYVYMKKQAEAEKVQMAEDLSSVRRSFAHKARTAVGEDDDNRYLGSIKAALGSYDDELKRVVFRKKPEARDPDDYRKKVEKQFEEGKLDEGRRKSMIEGYEVVRDAYDTLISAQWQPVLTAKGSADTRLDIYTMRRITDEEGRPVLEGKFLFWGIEDSTQVSWGEMTMRLWAQEPPKSGGRGGGKAREKVLGRAEGEAQPRLIVQRPHKYIADFPSFVSIGRIWLPVLPAEATYVDLEYSYRTRTGGGGEVESVLKSEKLEIPRGWKLQEGQQWEADEVEATEDEIAGKDPKAEEETN